MTSVPCLWIGDVGEQLWQRTVVFSLCFWASHRQLTDHREKQDGGLYRLLVSSNKALPTFFAYHVVIEELRYGKGIYMYLRRWEEVLLSCKAELQGNKTRKWSLPLLVTYIIKFIFNLFRLDSPSPHYYLTQYAEFLNWGGQRLTFLDVAGL